MKILLIGGTGNISSDCAALLHERGHEIAVLTRGRTETPAQYHRVQADRKDMDSMRNALRDLKPDAVVNFIGFEVSDLELDFELFRNSIRHYVFISSTVVYQRPAPKLPYTEDAPQANEWWDYGQKKIACEQWLRERHVRDQFPLTIVRPSHTYSRLWIPNAISSASYNFAARLEAGKPVFVHDNGQTLWTVTAASDFAIGLAGLIGNPKAIGEAFHITSDEVLTWNQIYAEIAAALNVSAPKIVNVPTEFICEKIPKLIGNLKGDKAHPGVFDNSKIKAFVPEFKCATPFRVGIRKSVAYLRANPERRVFNPDVDTMTETVLNAFFQGAGVSQAR